MKKALGLTLVEVLVAIAVLSLVLVAMNAVLLSSIRQTAISGSRTQAVQILNYLGRRVVGGETALLPPSGTAKVYDYGPLGTAFPDLPREVRFADPALYKVEIANRGSPSWASGLGVAVNAYRIRVCWRQAGEARCTEAYTLSAPPGGAGPAAPPLPGIN